MGLLDLAKFMDDHEISWVFDKQSMRLNLKSFSTITGWVHVPAYHASSTYGTFQPQKNFAISWSWSIFLWDDLHFQPKFIHLSPKLTHVLIHLLHPFSIFASPKEVEMWPTGNDSSPGSPPPWTPPAARRGVHEEPGKKGARPGSLGTPLGPYFKFIPHVEHVWCFPFLSERLHCVPFRIGIIVIFPLKLAFLGYTPWLKKPMEGASVPQRAPACNTGSSASAQGARLPRLRPSAAVVAAASAGWLWDT